MKKGQAKFVELISLVIGIVIGTIIIRDVLRVDQSIAFLIALFLGFLFFLRR